MNILKKVSGNNIDKLIKEYGHDVCRNIIDKHYINLQTKNYDFGFIHKLPIAIIGQRRKNKPNDFVYSFINNSSGSLDELPKPKFTRSVKGKPY